MPMIGAAAVRHPRPTMSDPGYVYVFTNPSIPNKVKIGRTARTPKQRARELRTTGVPEPFDEVYSAYFADHAEAEKYVHRSLKSHRTSNSREFFDVSVGDAVAAVKDAERHFQSPVSTGSLGLVPIAVGLTLIFFFVKWQTSPSTSSYTAEKTAESAEMNGSTSTNPLSEKHQRKHNVEETAAVRSLPTQVSGTQSLPGAEGNGSHAGEASAGSTVARTDSASAGGGTSAHPAIPQSEEIPETGVVDAAELTSLYSRDSKAADRRYKHKTIQVMGRLTRIREKDVSIGSIKCKLVPGGRAHTLAPGTMARLEGSLKGKSAWTGTITLENCILLMDEHH